MTAKKAKKPVEDTVDRGFVYADFLPAGHHQFILYDITSDTFWMHDFFLDMSETEILLSIPPKVGPPPPKPPPRVVPNVWRPWINNKKEILETIYDNDQKRKNGNTGKKFFEPEEVLPSGEVKKCHEALEKHYEIILTMYKHMQAGSKNYPEVNYKDLYKFFFKLQLGDDFGEGFDELAVCGT